MNLNEFAKKVTLKEGKKANISIAQVKEVLKITFTMLSKMSISEVSAILKKYNK